VAADSAAAHHDHEGVAQLIEALGRQEDAVPRQLLEDQLIVEVAGLGPSGEFLGPDVFLVGRGYRSEARELLGQGLLLVINQHTSVVKIPPLRVALENQIEGAAVGMSTDFLQWMVVARVGDRVFEPGHSLLV
jgi:hypothetical protein